MSQRDDIMHGFTSPSACIYVMSADETATKIGISTNMHARARSIQTGHERIIRIFWAMRLEMSHARKLEKAVHSALSKTVNHARGEWYYLEPLAAVAVIEKEISRAEYRVVPDLAFGMFRESIGS